MFNNIKLRIKVNTLDLEIEKLENIVKNNLYDGFSERNNLLETIEILSNENKKLRTKVNDLKYEQIKQKKSNKNNAKKCRRGINGKNLYENLTCDRCVTSTKEISNEI